MKTIIMPTKLGKDVDTVLNAKVGSTKKPAMAICTKTGTRVMDVIHGISLLAVLGTALWNVVLTVNDEATVEKMKPVFITTLIAAIIKIPSQICAAQGRLGGWLTVIGSITTVIITTIMIGYLTFDPKYANDFQEDVCIVTSDKDAKGNNKVTTYSAKIDSSSINTNASDSKFCQTVIPLIPKDGELRQGHGRDRRGPQSKAHWSPIFHV